MRNFKTRFYLSFFALFFLAYIQNLPLALANTEANVQASFSDNGELDQPSPKKTEEEKAVFQLAEVQQSLQDKLSERNKLRKSLSNATEIKAKKINDEIESLSREIELLEKTFEQIAIGGVDLSVFGVEEKKFDWREELITIIKPLLENVKSLTEKPRKIENLRRVIDEKNLARETSIQAIESINQLLSKTNTQSVTQKLNSTLDDWSDRLEDINRETQLAEYQLNSLEGKGVPWLKILESGFTEFIEGRGLTLVFVIAVILIVLALMRSLLWLARKRVSNREDKKRNTHYRLAAYGYRVLTVLLICISIMMVLYFRQDLLLLAVMVVVLIGVALALKSLLPKYITEGRILLNMGGVRESERVIYRGIPWEVSSINVHSRFINPEIRGGIRLPISQMHEMVSRPFYQESWFPSSEGDWILGTDGNPEQVMKQTIDVVELKDLNEISHTIPTNEYYELGLPNISRAEQFRIAVEFGIDYATQTIDPEVIENAFIEGIEQSLSETEFGRHLQEVNVDFSSAGDSSLNYLMLAKFNSDAARFYNRIKRNIQRACVEVCNENGWGIPFPQITVHQGGNSNSGNKES